MGQQHAQTTSESTEEIVLRGRVVDPSGAPLAGVVARYVPDPATLNVMGFDSPIEEDSFVVNFGALALEALPESVTGEDGRFELRSERVFGRPEDLYKWRYWNRGGVLVTADGYASSLSGYFLDDPPEHDFGDIQLDREFEATGRIVDEEGAPLLGAEVRLESLSRWYPRRRMLDAGDVLRLGGLDRARTNDSGRFRFRGLGTGAAFFSIQLDGHAAAMMTISGASGGRIDTGDIVLPSAKSVGGTVTDEGGEPMAGAEVWLADANFDRRRTPGALMGPPRWYEEGNDCSQNQIAALRKHRLPHAEVDQQGRFEVAGRGSPSYDLYVHAPEYRLHRVESVVAGQAVEIALLRAKPGAGSACEIPFDPAPASPPVRVELHVVDDRGRLVPDADVYVVEYQGAAGDLRGQTGPDGRFRLEVPKNAPVVAYAALGKTGLSDRVRIVVGDDVTGEQERLILHPTGRVSGTVHGEDGAVVPYGWIDIQPLGEGDPWLQPHARDVRARADGRFEIEGLPVGHYSLNTGYYDRGSGIEVIVEAGRTATVRVQRQREATRIAGTVRTGSEPVAWAEVEGARKGEPFAYFSSWTDEAGNFDGWAEEPGDFELSVESRAGGQAGPKLVTVAEGERARVDFELPTGSIEGVAFGDDEEEVGGAFVLLTGPGGEENTQDFTRADGSFSFSHLSDGLYTLHVARRGFGFDHARMTLMPAKFEVLVRGGQPARRSLHVTEGVSLGGSIHLPSGVGARDGTRVSLVQIHPKPDPNLLHEGYTAVTYSWLGTYQFRGLAPGKYRVLAEADSADDVRSTGVLVELGAENLRGVDLTLERPGPRPRWSPP